MRSFLNDLYFGKFIPCERKYTQVADDPKMQKIGAIKGYFKNLLSPEDYKKIEEIECLQIQSYALEDVSLFEYGFCAGILMMMDVFNFKEGQRSEQESC